MMPLPMRGEDPTRDDAPTYERWSWREDDAGQVGTGTSARWCWDKRDGAACCCEREMVLHVGASARWCWSWEEEVEVEVEGAGGWWR
jgi:hypothetical protein